MDPKGRTYVPESRLADPWWGARVRPTLLAQKQYQKRYSTLWILCCPTPYLGAHSVAHQTTSLCLCSLPTPQHCLLDPPKRVKKVPGTISSPPSVAGSFTAPVTLAEEISLGTEPSIGGIIHSVSKSLLISVYRYNSSILRLSTSDPAPELHRLRRFSFPEDLQYEFQSRPALGLLESLGFARLHHPAHFCCPRSAICMDMGRNLGLC